jgi:hypothetical protein
MMTRDAGREGGAADEVRGEEWLDLHTAAGGAPATCGGCCRSDVYVPGYGSKRV